MGQGDSTNWVRSNRFGILKNHGILSLGTQHGGRAGRQGRGDFVIVWIKDEALGARGCLEAYSGRSSLAIVVYLCLTGVAQSDNQFLQLVGWLQALLGVWSLG